MRSLFWVAAIPLKLTSLSPPAASFAPATVSANDLHSPFAGRAARSASLNLVPSAFAPPGKLNRPAPGPEATGRIRASISVTLPSPTSTGPGSVSTAPASSTDTAYSPTGSRATRNSPWAPERARSASPVSTSRTTTHAPATGAPAALSTHPPIAPSVADCAHAPAPRPQPSHTSHTPTAAFHPTHPNLWCSPYPTPIGPRSRNPRATRRLSRCNRPKPVDLPSRTLRTNSAGERDTTRFTCPPASIREERADPHRRCGAA
jgi:hypothetical protein